MRQIFDSDIGGIYYNEISYCNTRIENGLWVAYYPNGIKNYEVIILMVPELEYGTGHFQTANNVLQQTLRKQMATL